MRVFGELLEEELGDGSEMVLVTALLADSPENLPKSWDSHEGRNGPWREVYVGEWDSSSVAEQYGFLTTPTFFVIGADGTIEAADLNIIQAFRRVMELLR